MTQLFMRVPCSHRDRGCPAVLEASGVEGLLLAYVAHSHGCMHGAGPVELGDVLDTITVICPPAQQQRAMTSVLCLSVAKDDSSRLSTTRRRGRDLLPVRLPPSHGGHAAGDGC